MQTKTIKIKRKAMNTALALLEKADHDPESALDLIAKLTPSPADSSLPADLDACFRVMIGHALTNPGGRSWVFWNRLTYFGEGSH